MKILKKTHGYFWNLTLSGFFLGAEGRKNGSSAMASTDRFLSFVHIKEPTLFLLKTLIRLLLKVKC